jgi:prolyl-tRNA editing enzyme YbaK/EbsC (Cys-tRNA(Pro) deacylase)
LNIALSRRGFLYLKIAKEESMSIERVRQYFKILNKDEDILEMEESTATVDLAAAALDTEPARIAKSLSFKNEDGAMIVVVAGDAKIDNKKFKQEFG